MNKNDGIMKKYRIELRREYFEGRVFVDARKDIERITGLLWGLCSIPCNNETWLPTAFSRGFIFSTICDEEHLTKFLYALDYIYPDIKDYIRVIEEDEHGRSCRILITRSHYKLPL